MPERDANQPCVCGGNDWIRSDAYGKPYENGYALCGHCARPNTARGQRRDENQLAADVRAGIVNEPPIDDERPIKWITYLQVRSESLAALAELVAHITDLEAACKAERQGRHRMELRKDAAEAQVAALTQERDGLRGDVQFQYERRKGAEAALATTRQALAKYGRHRSFCGWQAGSQCTCGLAGARAATDSDTEENDK